MKLYFSTEIKLGARGQSFPETVLAQRKSSRCRDIQRTCGRKFTCAQSAPLRQPLGRERVYEELQAARSCVHACALRFFEGSIQCCLFVHVHACMVCACVCMRVFLFQCSTQISRYVCKIEMHDADCTCCANGLLADVNMTNRKSRSKCFVTVWWAAGHCEYLRRGTFCVVPCR